jgi:plastocyanin
VIPRVDRTASPTPPTPPSPRTTGRGRGARLTLAAALLAGAGLAAACSSAGDGSASTGTTSGDAGGLDLSTAVDLTGRTTVEIEVADNVYEPKVFTVDPGTTITFRNKGANPHNVIPVTTGEFPPIDTGQLDPGMTASITVGDAGPYRFYCSLHGTPNKGQRGVVVVGGPRR